MKKSNKIIICQHILVAFVLLMQFTPSFSQGQIVKRHRNKSGVVNKTKLTPLERKIVGKHLLSLQWISWDYFGTAIITKKSNGKYYCKGSQFSKENSDYLKMEGSLTIASEDHLVLNGYIETRVSDLNNGYACRREGSFDFVQTQGRHFWRLQQMGTCDGPNTVDYIDIYLK